MIARSMDRVLFSGGVLPTLHPLPVPTAAPPEGPEVAAGRVTRPRRVSRDLLPPGPVAQPETQTEPYLAINPEDFTNLLAGYKENHFENGGARALNYSVSFDGGKSWIEGILPKLTIVDGGPWEKASDPWVAYAPGDTAVFASLLFNETTPDNAIGVSISTDGGLTWDPPVEVFRSTDDFNDKEAVTVDTFPTSPHLGNIYVGWDINVNQGGQFVDQQLVVARSTNGGKSYRRPARIRKTGTNIGAIPRVGPDGTVYAIWSGGPGTQDQILSIYFSKSENGGRTWSKPEPIALMLAVGVPDQRVGDILASFAVDPINGDLYVAWEDARWTGVDHATLMYSRDGGKTWSEPKRVSDGPAGAASYTVSVAVNHMGHVAVSYYSQRNDPTRSFFVDEYIRISKDGGLKFQKSRRASRRSFDVRFAAQSRGFFLGDYVGLAAADKRFHLLWTATPLLSSIDPSRKQPDIFAAKNR